MAKLPNVILLYQCDVTEDGQPIYSHARTVDDIPEEFEGQWIGAFKKIKDYKLTIKRELK